MKDVFEMTSDELNSTLAGLAAGQEAELPTEGVCPPSVTRLLAAEAAALEAFRSWDFSQDLEIDLFGSTPTGADRWLDALKEVWRCR